MSMTTTHFTDALFEDLAETNYSTHKTIDWATLDREVKFKFGNNLPFEHLYAIPKTSRPDGI